MQRLERAGNVVSLRPDILLLSSAVLEGQSLRGTSLIIQLPLEAPGAPEYQLSFIKENPLNPPQ